MHKTYNVHTFSSPSEFALHCQQNNIIRDVKGVSFTGNLSGEKAVSLAIFGDDSFVAPAEKLISEIDIQIDTSQWFDMPSVSGCYPCVPEALAGEPECMREPVAISDDSNPITIVVELACSSAMTREQMESRGAAVMAVVMALSATRPVSLKLIGSSNAAPKDALGNSCGIVAIELSTTPLDLATTAAMISHVGFYRQLIMQYTHEWYGGISNWADIKGNKRNSGHTNLYENAIRHYMGLDENAIYICGAASDSDIVANPKKWVFEQLVKYQHHE